MQHRNILLLVIRMEEKPSTVNTEFLSPTTKPPSLVFFSLK